MAPLPALTKKRHTLADVPEESLAFALFHRELQRETAAPLESFADEDLGKWEKKAIKAVKAGKSANVSFESGYCSAVDQAELRITLAIAEDVTSVKAAFQSLKAQDLTSDEQQLANSIASLFRTIGRTFIAAIMQHQSVDMSILARTLPAALQPVVLQSAIAMLQQLSLDIGLDIDDAQAMTHLIEWSTTYTADLANGITITTQKLVEEAIRVYRSTPDMTRADLELLLSAAFGKRRAETIAVTEITRAASQATRHYQSYLAEYGLNFVRVNHTNADDKVCAVCGPLDGKAEADWPSPDGPPWHPRCRCMVTLERIDD